MSEETKKTQKDLLNDDKFRSKVEILKKISQGESPD